jgi:hypothetical protein
MSLSHVKFPCLAFNPVGELSGSTLLDNHQCLNHTHQHIKHRSVARDAPRSIMEPTHQAAEMAECLVTASSHHEEACSSNPTSQPEAIQYLQE